MTVSISRTFRHSGAAGEAASALEGVAGVLDIRPARGNGLRITYDVVQTDYGALQRRLSDAGFPPPEGWLARMRSGWNQFQDENLRANAGHKPACCSKPPPGAGRH